MSERGASGRAPDVSVVVATHDRPRRLRMLLAGLRRQTLPAERFEVVVVDDGSGSETAGVLDRERERGGLRLSVLRNADPLGPAAARDRGWRAAEAEVIAFTDDDCVPAPPWLEAGLAALGGNPGAIVQGRTEPAPGEVQRRGPFTRTIEVRRLDAGFATSNMLYPRSLLERVDGFDTAAFGRAAGGEDADLAWRIIATGARAVFAPRALVHHAVNELGPIGKLRVAARWTNPMQAYARHPELRRAHFVNGIFWKGTHYLLFRAALSLALPRRLRSLAPWLMAPYLQELLARRRRERARAWVLPYYLVHDLVECWAILRASIRYRHPMI